MISGFGQAHNVRTLSDHAIENQAEGRAEPAGGAPTGGRPTIFLSAAEASGDEHAARLIAALRRRLPGARFVGVAGERMAAEGCEVIADLSRQASMGTGPFLRLGYYLRALRRVRRAIREIRPDVLVPVDSPAWNWHLAKTARGIGSPVVYYIAPQVWAWAPWRVRKVAALTDAVACILPFEEPYFRHRGVRAVYVGHPLLETLPARGQMPDILEAWAHGQWRVALLPGSRPGEITHHAGVLAAAAKAIRRRWPRSRCTFVVRDEASAEHLRRALGGPVPAGADIVVGRTREMLAQSHFAVAVSGTVTLEVAHFGVPMVVVYRVGLLFRLLHRLTGKWAVPTPHFALANILAGRRIVPEFMPWRGRTRQVIDMVMELMEEPGYLLEARQDLVAAVDSLGKGAGGTASDNAADLIVRLLEKKRLAT